MQILLKRVVGKVKTWGPGGAQRLQKDTKATEDVQMMHLGEQIWRKAEVSGGGCKGAQRDGMQKEQSCAKGMQGGSGGTEGTGGREHKERHGGSVNGTEWQGRHKKGSLVTIGCP